MTGGSITKEKVVIKEIPYSTTTESLIHSIETAAQKVHAAKLERNFAHRLYIGV